MRALPLGALIATLAGCTCVPHPIPVADEIAETPFASRPENEKSAPVKNGPKPSFASIDKKTNPVATKAKYSTAGKTMPLPSAPHKDNVDPAMEKAKATVAAMMQDPASSTFAEMKRVVRNLLGDPVEAICGRVRGKYTAGGDPGELPFVFIVANDEAYIVDGSSTTAATAYRNLCD